MKKGSTVSEISGGLREVNVGLLRGLIGSIPVVGGYLNEAVFDIRARLKQKRFESLVEYLHLQVQALDEKAIDVAFMESEEFLDIFEKVVEKSTKTKHAQKRELYANIISGSLKAGRLEDYDKEIMYIDILDALTLHELLVLKYLSPKKSTGKGHSFLFEEASREARDKRREHRERHQFEFEAVYLDYYKEQLFELVPADTRIAVEGLIAKSLAMDDSASRIDTQPRTYICITPLGNKFVNYIAAKVEA